MRIRGYLTVLFNSPRVAASFQQALLVGKSGTQWQAALALSLLPGPSLGQLDPGE